MLNGNRMKSGRGRSPRDFYKTPLALAERAIDILRYDEELGYYFGIDALDAGCGDGIWGKAAQGLVYAGTDENDYPYIDGIDIQPGVKSWSEYYNNVYEDDFLTHDFGKKKYDLVFGNPPYSLAEEFIKRAFQLTEEGGYVYFLLRLAFLEGINRYKYFWPYYPLKTLYVCSRRPSFYQVNGRNTTDTLAYAMFLWENTPLFDREPILKWMDWDYD